MDPDQELLFDALTPLGFRVPVTHERWKLITTVKHPVMVGREADVKNTLENPEQIVEAARIPTCCSSTRARANVVGSVLSRNTRRAKAF